MSIHNSSRYHIVEAGSVVEWREPQTYIAEGDSGNDTGHLAELVDFVGAVRDNRKSSRSSIAESWRSMALYEAIRQSATSGAPERVDI